MFYVSEYLERHRDVYYDRLHTISHEGDWNGWVDFFLKALVEQAQANTLKTQNMLALYARMKADVPTISRSQYVVQAIDVLFDRPIFRGADFAQRSGIPLRSAVRILNTLKESGIVRDLRPKRGRRGAVMVFPELLQITEE